MALNSVLLLLLTIAGGCTAFEICRDYYKGTSYQSHTCSDYCCGTRTYKYCCSMCSMSYYDTDCSSWNSKDDENMQAIVNSGISMAIIIVIVIGVVIFIAVVGGIIACCVCGCCAANSGARATRGVVHNNNQGQVQATVTSTTVPVGSYPVQQGGQGGPTNYQFGPQNPYPAYPGYPPADATQMHAMGAPPPAYPGPPSTNPDYP